MSEKLIQDINVLAEEYYKLSQELAEISERKGTSWLELRKECKTNAETDQQWAASADGKREAYLKIYLKGLGSLKGAKTLAFKADRGIL